VLTAAALLATAVPALQGSPATAAAPPPPVLKGYSAKVKKAINAVSEKNLKQHAYWLAGDPQEGREAGTLAGHRVQQYLVNFHRSLGTEDPVGDGSYTQYFMLRGAQPKRGEVQFVNWAETAKSADDKKKARFAFKADMRPLRFSGDGGAAGQVAFVGYGITGADGGYDDYAGIDVAGKVVLALPGTPAGVDYDGLEAAGDPLQKAKTAQAKGAQAFVLIADPTTDPKTASSEGVAAWPPPKGQERLKGFPCLVVSEKAADRVLKLGGKRRASLKNGIDKSGKPASVVLKRSWFACETGAQGPRLGQGSNIAALYRATAKDAVDEYIVIGAHRDHVGYGRFGSKGKQGEIHNGADDNASGTSGLLELARVLVENKLELRRHVLILHFDAEEKGLLGSKHYASAPLVPMDKTVAMLNMDMIGRNETNKIMCGPPEDDRNPALQNILMKISRRFGVALPGKGMGQYMMRSDQAPFIEKGVPAIFLFGGMHGDYHTQNDDPNKLNYTKMGNISKLILLFAVEVAALPERP
jgi:hypothetical protein